MYSVGAIVVILLTYSENMSYCDTETAKAAVILVVVTTLKRMGFSKVIVKGECGTVFKALGSRAKLVSWKSP
ncbi:hypothetical protein PanWU01x14_314690 [Parasponia andersonii]|uniref:Uncharacterized protein n=1 Tax=Parasponia andersonii TaxID=3476 RepID=A0A2P5ANP6_PARAD|nr:hypothetical protein PanWU01x14_314690 [Parasponia andersonii]